MYRTVTHTPKHRRNHTNAHNITLEKTAWNLCFLYLFFFKEKVRLKIKGMKCKISKWCMLFHSGS